MPTERLSMRHIREVLRLHHSVGMSQRSVARSLGLAQGTVSKYLNRTRRAGLTWPLPPELDDDGGEVGVNYSTSSIVRRSRRCRMSPTSMPNGSAAGSISIITSRLPNVGLCSQIRKNCRDGRMPNVLVRDLRPFPI